MWIQIDDDCAREIAACDPGQSSRLKYIKDRIQHYQELSNCPIAKRFRDAAQGCGRDGDLDVDDDAVVSLGSDEGAYVMSWTWVTNEKAGFDSEKGSEDLEELDLPQENGNANLES